MINNLIPRIRRKLARMIYTQNGKDFLDRPDIVAIHSRNRESLKSVAHWVDDGALEASYFKYGMPDYAHSAIDKDIGDSATYTDMMLSLASRLVEPVRYLELGVSVGKNFFQVSRCLEGSSLMGFDIENINPVLASQFELVSERNWPTMPTSIRKTESRLLTMTQQGSANQVKYLAGDVLDEGCWKELSKEGPFNLIFSDALHTTEALIWEYEMLVKYDLLNENDLIICWDDLEGEMLDAFHHITSSLVKKRRKRGGHRFLMSIKGWMGENERDHCVGFFIG